MTNDAESIGLGHFEPTEEDKRHAHDDLLRWCGESPEFFQGQKPLVAEGHPSQQILAAIETERIDLVVVGARGLGAIGRMLLGSTSEHLLTHSPCSVLVVHQHEKP